MSSNSKSQSVVCSTMRGALLCAALGTTALTTLTVAPDAAHAACVAGAGVVGGPTSFNVNNTAVPLNLTNDCPAPGVSNIATVLPGNTVTTAVNDAINTGALQWEVNNQGTITSVNNIGVFYAAANGVVTNSGTINGIVAVSFNGGGNSTFTNNAGGIANGNLGTTIVLSGTGTVTNHGAINAPGFGNAVFIGAAGGIVNNTGTITSTNALGVSTFGGGTVTNAQGASITSSAGSVQFTTTGGTFINAGTVTSNLTNTAFIGSGDGDI
ncbi:MAG: hypothetical protein AAFY01_06815, partial [Pseudomonadota bacterium]